MFPATHIASAALVGCLLAIGCGVSTPLDDADLYDGTDGDRDGEPLPECPPDMVRVVATMVCVDRFEASQDPDGGALSVGDAAPWTHVTWDEAAAACEDLGKRLCREDEWFQACGGPRDYRYPYGDSYEEHYCNGSEHEAGVAMATGSMPDCEGGYAGLFDMSGNVWEWVDSCSDDLCRVRGGSFNRHEVGMRCTGDLGFGPDERYASIGFRCCLSL